MVVTLALLEESPRSSTAPDLRSSVGQRRPLRLVRNQPGPDWEAVIQEILDALHAAEHELAVRAAGVPELAQLEVQVATLRSLYHDLSATIAGTPRAPWDRAPRRAPQASSSRP